MIIWRSLIGAEGDARSLGYGSANLSLNFRYIEESPKICFFQVLGVPCLSQSAAYTSSLAGLAKEGAGAAPTESPI